MSVSGEPKDIEGIAGVVAKQLERVHVRLRLSNVTRSAWKLEATSPSGDGAITLVEVSAQESYHRGDGIFLGWSQEKLASAYQALVPKSSEPDPELPQLG